MKATVCFAVDCGPTRSGAALVELADGWHRILWGGHPESRGAELLTQIRSAARVGAIFAIERLQGYAYEAKRVAQLIETAQAEGLIDGAAAEIYLQEAADRALTGRPPLPRLAPLPITARDWRGELCRSSTASDAQIRLVVEGMCPVRPTLKAEVRPHVWDAAGLAIVALARENGRPVVLPPSVSAGLHNLQVDEKRSRAARKARGEPLGAETRWPTKAQRERRGAAAKRGWVTRNGGA